MKKLYTLFIICASAVTTMFADSKTDGTISVRDLSIQRSGDNCVVSMQLVLDSVHMRSNHQVFITPYLENGTESVQLPSIVLSGRNMHYQYLRTGKTKATGKTKYEIREEIYHKGGVGAVKYSEMTEMQPWMLNKDASLALHFDSCGCGKLKGQRKQLIPLNLNPLDNMLIVPYPSPVPEKDVIAKHEGRAKVQFQVDKFELHEEVYTYTNRITKRRHTIDNREQLQLIDDSLRYALKTPNVELVKLEICGFASPESPYSHNEYLAQNRAKAVMMYLEKHEGIADSICSYDAVPENWADFRQQVLAAKDITEKQRADLLALIDRPCHSPLDYDRKEKELNTSPAFAKLYKEKIRPDWFPDLRYTQFAFYTHLKPLTDEQLKEVMETTPELMSLNQFYRLASLYPHGSEEFHRVMLTALKWHSDDEVCNTNAAALAVEDKDYEKADEYLKKAGDRDDANILRGIVATYKGDIDAAREFFRKAQNNPIALTNLQLIGDK